MNGVGFHGTGGQDLRTVIWLLFTAIPGGVSTDPRSTPGQGTLDVLPPIRPALPKAQKTS